MRFQPYDYLLAGASGQIGRYLHRELLKRGSVALYKRDTRLQDYPYLSHIVNAAGYTSLNSKDIGRYWRDNVMLAVKLANHAYEVNASFHQLSSVAVAEFRDSILTENDYPIPNVKQLPYSTSKVLMELAVKAVYPEVQILRLGDVVPPLSGMDLDWRRNHWLPILFSQGKRGFAYARSNYSVWLSNTQELAEAITLLLDYAPKRFHVLGKRYFWGSFEDNAVDTQRPSSLIAQWMTNIILYGPEARQVDGSMTDKVLKKEGFEWSELDSNYWKAFAKRSVKK